MSQAAWTTRPEVGSMTLGRLLARIGLGLGRSAARFFLWPIALYFWLATPAARADSRAYLHRVLGRPPTLIERWRHYHTFSSVILDRLFLITGHTSKFDIELQGEPHLLKALDSGRGALLVGAHFGSFEVLRAVGRARGGLRVCMAMYEENARRISEFLRALDPTLSFDVVPLGRIDSMLEIQRRLDQGHFVGILADRSFGNDPTLSVPFLGDMAAFPTGGFRIAAALHRPVLMMAGIYLGANRYRIVIDELADFDAARTEGTSRSAAVRQAVERFADRLQQHCLDAPMNWFNFFDFWASARRDARRDE